MQMLDLILIVLREGSELNMNVFHASYVGHEILYESVCIGCYASKQIKAQSVIGLIVACKACIHAVFRALFRV